MLDGSLEEWYEREMHRILDAHIDGHLSRSWQRRSLQKLARDYEKRMEDLDE